MRGEVENKDLKGLDDDIIKKNKRKGCDVVCCFGWGPGQGFEFGARVQGSCLGLESRYWIWAA
ncbi:hypothetical protein G4B88_020942 [Cannabis sativa]|uniref:Uncharacterized protein n=1 Tax=Cannabis sativa TaxID=3483 RepID=A0A7J6DJI4_CANSA|nr:hypothetical protein G4B88_012820 [Cannabis sativa]KAF4369164.1 hypothetical protein G4B88_020942 [Cannabis sativa]